MNNPRGKSLIRNNVSRKFYCFLYELKVILLLFQKFRTFFGQVINLSSGLTLCHEISKGIAGKQILQQQTEFVNFLKYIRYECSITQLFIVNPNNRKMSSASVNESCHHCCYVGHHAQYVMRVVMRSHARTIRSCKQTLERNNLIRLRTQNNTLIQRSHRTRFWSELLIPCSH